MIAEMSALAAYLTEAQSARKTEIKCELVPVLSARVSDAALVEALIMGLPMAQGVQHRIIRSRGRGAVLTAKIRYREAVRMLEGSALTAEEMTALDAARSIGDQAIRMDGEEARFRYVYDWICQNVRYAHTAPGQKGYERLVGASGALLDGQANCQGFADVLYLLCGLSGIECEYRCGRGERRLHVWNAIFVDGMWLEVDVSKGARRLEIDISQTNFQQTQKTTTQDAKNMLY